MGVVIEKAASKPGDHRKQNMFWGFQDDNRRH
jgi:hypothetical protein